MASRSTTWLALVVALLLPMSAQATIVTYAFTGTINAEYDLTWSAGEFTVGDSVFGTVKYDTSVPDSEPAAFTGFYAGPGFAVSASFSSGYVASGASWGRAFIYDDSALSFASLAVDGLTGPMIGTYTLYSASLGLADSTDTAFSGVPLTMPMTLPPISAFDILNGSALTFFPLFGSAEFVGFDLTTLELASAPAPGALALLCLGLLGIGATTRRRLN